MLYDVTKKKIRQDFQKIPNVTCLSTDRNDKYIAAGNTSGCLYVLNLITSRPAFTQPIRVAGMLIFLNKILERNQECIFLVVSLSRPSER